MIDLHMHTIYSDGASLPEELVRGAFEHGLEAIAITDHDNTESYLIAKQVVEDLVKETDKSFTLIPGIEINTHWSPKEVHILGYFLNPEDAALQALTKRHREARTIQIREMVDTIRKKARIDIHFEEVLFLAKEEGSVGRPHVAQAIINKGGASNMGDAFQKYLNPKAPTYVRRNTASPHEAVEVIYEAGGIPVIAHPGDMETIEDLTKDLMNYGLRGLEAYHKSHSPALIEFHCTLAEKYGLIVTGGTDYHGAGDAYTASLGRFYMPPSVYEELQNEYQRLSLSAVKAS